MINVSETGKFIESKPEHGSQKSRWVDTSVLEVTLELIPNFELEKLLLSFGEGVKVLGPTDLVNSIKEKISSAAKYYD